VSIGALVQRVDQALDRAGSLFGNPPEAGGPAALSSSGGLAAAGDIVRTSQAKISTATSGQFATAYHGFATDAGPALDAAAGSDKHMSDQLTAAADADRSGKASSGSVRQGAATDTTALAPFTGTHSGKIAMLQALRTRIAQQQQVLAAYQSRAARLAALVRASGYGSGGLGGGGMPMGGMPFGGGTGGGGSGGGGLGSGLGGLTQLAGNFTRIGSSPRTAGQSGLASPTGLVGTPLGALTVNSSPREVAAAIIHEARRRGYSPAQTIPILADAMQESGLNPKAVSPNGLWKNIFQQDSSYPGRDNPNLAISEFFNRLATHGGPTSPDIAKSIFWLQQRPGEPSADAAYAHGRQAYLAEFLRQVGRARDMYNSIVGR